MYKGVISNTLYYIWAVHFGYFTETDLSSKKGSDCLITGSGEKGKIKKKKDDIFLAQLELIFFSICELQFKVLRVGITRWYEIFFWKTM